MPVEIWGIEVSCLGTELFEKQGFRVECRGSGGLLGREGMPGRKPDEQEGRCEQQADSAEPFLRDGLGGEAENLCAGGDTVAHVIRRSKDAKHVEFGDEEIDGMAGWQVAPELPDSAGGGIKSGMRVKSAAEPAMQRDDVE